MAKALYRAIASGMEAGEVCFAWNHGGRRFADVRIYRAIGVAMKFRTVLAVVIGFVAACCFQQRADAGQTNIAVAANFTEAAKEIATAFKAKTGHDAALSFGATGQLYTQITQSAPFEVFLAADEARPRKAVEDGFAAPDSLFTYAIGKLVLWSKDPALVKGPRTLITPPSPNWLIAIPSARHMAPRPSKR